MRPVTRLSRPLGVALLAASVGTISCSDAPSEVDHAAMHAADATASTAKAVGNHSASTESLLKTVHAKTARFHSTVQATKAGYAVASPCVAVPGLGGMGYHWVDFAKIDPAFIPTEPEAILYEPDRNGTLQLVGVEYIVIDVGQPHPSFGDHPLDVGGVPDLAAANVPHYSLHVWVHKDNPAGVFTRFNPTVVCPAP